MKRVITLGLLVTFLAVGSPLAPPPPAQAENVPIVVLIPGVGVLVLCDGDPDTPDGNDESRSYVVYDDSGNVIEVEQNWLTEFLFDTFGTWLDLSK